MAGSCMSSHQVVFNQETENHIVSMTNLNLPKTVSYLGKLVQLIPKKCHFGDISFYSHRYMLQACHVAAKLKSLPRGQVQAFYPKRNERRVLVFTTLSRTLWNTIKIMPCAEGDRSDCQPEASSIVRSGRLRAVVVAQG